MKLHPHSKANRWGFTLTEFFIIVVVLAVLAAAFLPAFMKARVRASRLNCVNQLKQAGLAFRTWAQYYGDNYPMQVSVTNGGTRELIQSGKVYPHFLVMSNELNTPKILVCPEDKTRGPISSFTTNFGDANISYFIGLDAQATQPQMLLAGDRNLEFDGVTTKTGIVNLTTNNMLSWTKAMHRRRGYVLLVDGSVHLTDKDQLVQLLRATGTATNRLAIP